VGPPGIGVMGLFRRFFADGPAKDTHKQELVGGTQGRGLMGLFRPFDPLDKAAGAWGVLPRRGCRCHRAATTKPDRRQGGAGFQGSGRAV